MSSTSALPPGWGVTALGEIRVDHSITINPSRSREEFFELYSIPAFPFGRPELVEGHAIGSSKISLVPGTVIVSKINPRINRVWVVGDYSPYSKLGSSEWIPFFPVDGVLPHYLAYALRRDGFRDYLAANVSGVGGSLMRVRPAVLERYHVDVAPTKEQRRIVEAIESHFSRLDDAAATLERVQQNLKRYRASVLQAAVEGRLVPTEAELARDEGREYEHASVLLERILAERRRRWEEAQLEKMKAKGKLPKDDKWTEKYKQPASTHTNGLPELPEGWCWTSVDTVGEVLLGRQRAPQYLTGRHPRPYLRVANIKDDRIDFSDIETMDFGTDHFQRYRLQTGDILVSEGQSPELLGQSAIYRGGVAGLCFQKTLHRFRPFLPGPSSEFAQLVFRAHVRTGIFRKLGSITTNIAHLTLSKFKAAPFPLPPEAEQHRIVAEAARILSNLNDVEAEVRTQKRRIQRLRQSILKWAFEGRLVDQDPSDEPASVLLDRIKAERAAATNGGARTNRRQRSPGRRSAANHSRS